MAKLIKLLDEQNSQSLKTIVFVKDSAEAEFVADSLVENNLLATSIGKYFSKSDNLNFHLFRHLSEKECLNELKNFLRNKSMVLVTPDVPFKNAELPKVDQVVRFFH